MLYLIGSGLGEGEFTERGISALNKCKKIYYEDYTSFQYFKEGERLSRERVESEEILKEAKEKDIALVVPGDPLFATTHISLILSCIEKGINYEIIHAPSIINALGELGISLYNFGPIVSIPKPEPGYDPESFFEKIKQNKSLGFHTLILVDPRMKYEEAYSYLLSKDKEKIIKEEELLAIKYERRLIADFANKIRFEPPFSFVLLGKINGIEKEFLYKMFLK